MLRANPDLVDHPPHLLQAELADEPAGRLIEASNERKRCRRQQVVVDANR
jgi:hypothetical protein